MKLSLISLFLAGCCLLVWLTDSNRLLFLALNQFLQQLLPDGVWLNLSLMGDALWVAAFSTLFLARKPHFIIALAINGVLAAVAVRSMKIFFGVLRPPAVLQDNEFRLLGDFLSQGALPSGHSATAFLVAALVLVYFPHRFWVLSAWCFACLIALSRIAIGIHWPEDILLGAAIGWFFGVSVLFLEPFLRSLRLISEKQWLIFGLGYASSLTLLFHDSGLPSVMPLQVTTAYMGMILSTLFCAKRCLRLM